MTDVKFKNMIKLFNNLPFEPLGVSFQLPDYYALNVSGESNDGNDGDKPESEPNVEPNKSKADTDSPNLNNGFSTEGLEAITLEGEETDYYLSDKGEVVDSTGKVKYSKNEYNKIVNSGGVDDVPDTYTLVEIDGFTETVYLNEKKELVNAKGDVLKTAEQVEAEYDMEGDSSNPFIEGLKATNLFDEVDQYEFKPETVTTVVNTAYDKGVLKGKDEAIVELKSKYPQLDDVIRHMELYGTDFSNFNKLHDYTSIDINENTSMGVLDSIVKDWHREKNIEINQDYIQFLKNGDKYPEYVSKLKADLSNMVVQKKTEMDRQIAERNAAKQKQINEYWGISVDDKGNIVDLNITDSVYNKVLKTGELQLDNETLQIPKVIRSNITGEPKEYSRQDFFNWLYIPKPVEIDGERINATGYDIYLYNKTKTRTVNHDVVDAFTAFTNGDKSQLIKQSVTKHVKNQKSIKLNTKGGGSSNKSTNRKTDGKPKLRIN